MDTQISTPLGTQFYFIALTLLFLIQTKPINEESVMIIIFTHGLQ